MTRGKLIVPETTVKTSLCLLLGLLLPLSAALARDAFPPPPDADVEMIAPSITSRGVTMTIRRIEVEAGIEDVLLFYRELWGDTAKESHLPPWRMIGRIDDGQFHNVQVQTRGETTWGYLSTSNLPAQVRKNKPQPVLTRHFPMMNGSTVIDDQSHDDPGKKGRVIILVNDFSVKSNHNFYRRHFQAKGWKIIMDEQTEPRGQAFAMHANLGAKTISMTIAQQDGQTTIVANEVQRRLLQ